DGAPLKSARVVLAPDQRDSRGTPQYYGSVSDSDGLFTVKGVPAGRYTFFAMRTGYVSEHYLSRGSDKGAILALRPGQELSDVMFRMTAAGVVTGQVNDENGLPMSRVHVTALRLPNEEEADDDELFPTAKQQLVAAGSAETDDRGQYRIFDLNPGEYYIQAADFYEPVGRVDEADVARMIMGTNYAPLYYPGVAQRDQAQLVSLHAGQEAQADFSMRRVRTVTVSGRVVGPSKSAAHVSVELEEEDGEGYAPDHESSADEHGNFRISAVPAGTYVLHAYATVDRNTEYSFRQKFEVGNEDIDGVTITLGGGVPIRGAIRTDGRGALPSRDISVALRSLDVNDGVLPVRVEQGGSFEIISVNDGRYAVFVFGLDTGWYIKSIRYGGDDVLEKGLQLEKASGGGTLDVVISSATSQIAGVVVNGDQPIAGARVRAVPEPRTPFNRSRTKSAISDQTGHFVLDGMAPGKYRISARHKPSTGDTPLTSEPQVITLAEHDHQSVSLTIPPKSAE